MDDTDRRHDEAEALAAMFGDDVFFQMSPKEWILRCTHSDGTTQAELTICLPHDYPSCSPPELVLDAPGRGELCQACQELLRGFDPGEEFVVTLAQRFFEFCDDDAETGVEADSVKTVTSDQEGGIVVGVMAAIIDLKPDIAGDIDLSLADAGFQECGAGLFVHGELGVAVEITDKQLQVSIDGIDAHDDLVEWVARQLNDEISLFGKSLLEWADAQRASDETNHGSADGIIELSSDPKAGKITLTGNAAWKARLQAGETVEFRGGGNSLHPRIKSGECCRYSPVFRHDDIKEKDIVFCQIKGRYWGHMVKKKVFVGGRDEYEYTISNIHGWENGTCTLEHIYGKVIDHWK